MSVAGAYIIGQQSICQVVMRSVYRRPSAAFTRAGATVSVLPLAAPRRHGATPAAPRVTSLPAPLRHPRAAPSPAHTRPPPHHSAARRHSSFRVPPNPPLNPRNPTTPTTPINGNPRLGRVRYPPPPAPPRPPRPRATTHHTNPPRPLGFAVRIWQLGIEQQALFARHNWVGYPIYMSISGACGYYLEGVEDRQHDILQERKKMLIAKRARQAERDAAASESAVHA